MPFTFSHPAIVLPLTKLNQKYISATALIAGSMAPDFEYFINMELKQVHGHSISGLFYYCLPVTLLLTFIFHYTVRDALIKHSPLPIKPALASYLGFNWLERFKSHWFVILYSAIIGIASHLFWDEWTHANRFFVDRIPFLQEAHYFAGKKLLNAEIFWLLSSVVGGLVVIVSATSFSFHPEKKQKMTKSSIYWGIVAATSFLVLLLRGVSSIQVFIATSIAGTLIGLIIAPLFMKWLNIEQKIFHKE